MDWWYSYSTFECVRYELVVYRGEVLIFELSKYSEMNIIKQTWDAFDLAICIQNIQKKNICCIRHVKQR